MNVANAFEPIRSSHNTRRETKLMMYFLENQKAATAENLKSAGIQHLLPSPASREHAKGPGGKPGVLVVDDSIKVDRIYNSDSQTWARRFGSDGCYVGFWNDKPPTPLELMRPDAKPGTGVKLLDGNEWVVPVLRQYREDGGQIKFDCKLPTVFKQDEETGRMVTGEVTRQYRDVWNDACAIADRFIEEMKGGTIEIDTDVYDRFIGDVIGINYRVGLPEISVLGLLDLDCYSRVMFASLDWDRLRMLVGNVQRQQMAGATEAFDESTLKSGADQSTPVTNTPTVQP